MSDEYTFILESANNIPVVIKLTDEELFGDIRLNPKVIKELSKEQKCVIKSHIKSETLQHFFDFLINGTLESVNAENIVEFVELSKEISKEYVQRTFKSLMDNFGKEAEIIDNLINQKDDFPNNEIYQSQVSQNLDYHIQKNAEKLRKIPVTTLFNIFSNPKRSLPNHDTAYDFIVDSLKVGCDQGICLLISCLDGTFMSKDKMEDAFANKDNHLNFVPKIPENFFFDLKSKTDDIVTRFNKIEAEINDSKKSSNSINDLDKVINQLKEDQEKQYDRFVKHQDQKFEQFKSDIKDQINSLISKQEEFNQKLVDLEAKQTKLENNIAALQEQQKKSDSSINQLLAKQSEPEKTVTVDSKLESDIESVNKMVALNDERLSKLYEKVNALEQKVISHDSSSNDKAMISLPKTDQSQPGQPEKPPVAAVEKAPFGQPGKVEPTKAGQSQHGQPEKPPAAAAEKAPFKTRQAKIMPGSGPSDSGKVSDRPRPFSQITEPITKPQQDEDKTDKSAKKSAFALKQQMWANHINANNDDDRDSKSGNIIIKSPTILPVQADPLQRELPRKRSSSVILPPTNNSTKFIDADTFYNRYQADRTLSNIKVSDYEPFESLIILTLQSRIDDNVINSLVEFKRKTPKVKLGVQINEVLSKRIQSFEKFEYIKICINSISDETFSNGFFRSCQNIKNVDILSGLKVISPNLFAHCRNLKKIEFISTKYSPNSIHTIKNNAFEQCIGLTEIVLPPNLTSIEANAFYSCTNLKSVTFNVNSELNVVIGPGAFALCQNLEKCNLPKNLNSIGKDAFKGCKKLKRIFIPIKFVNSAQKKSELGLPSNVEILSSAND